MQPYIVFWIYAALSTMVWFGAMVMVVAKVISASKRADHYLKCLGIYLGAWVVFLVVFFALAIPVYPHTRIVAKDGTIKQLFRDYEILWRSDDRLKGGDRERYTGAEEIEVTMVVEPITENPKIRRVLYFIDVEIGGTPYSFLDYRRTVGKQNIRVWARNHLYEFNERRSREIGRFYNPLDKGQQEQFSSLAEKFLKPRFAGTGVKFVRAGFDLPLWHDSRLQRFY